MGFLKNAFGKKTCALCGNECGMMSRTKIKGGDYLCDDCYNQCSKFVRLDYLTLDEVEGHIEYMKRQNKLYEEVFAMEGKKVRYPSTLTDAGIEFCDDLGMFRIVYKNYTGRGKLEELFRYDQVLGYEAYYEEEPAEEAGKPAEFKEAGIKINLAGTQTREISPPQWLHFHPYVRQEIKVCFAKNRKDNEIYIDNAIHHFDHIFGKHSKEKGLFSLGLTQAEKRNIKSAAGMVDLFGTVIKGSKNGIDSITEEDKARLQADLNAVEDAATNGVGVYTRRADEAEAKI